MIRQNKFVPTNKFLRDHINQAVRTDGRFPNAFRPVGVNSGSLSKAVGSSVVKLGNTCVVCGIRAELACPRTETPQKGYFIPSVDLSYLTPSNPSIKDLSDTIITCILEILDKRTCLDLEQLCIHSEKLVWALYCDIILLDEDGSALDASILACFAAVKDVRLPEINYKADINEIEVLKEKIALTVNHIPCVSTHVIIEETLLTDPTSQEECLSSAIINIGTLKGKLWFILKSGEKEVSKEQLDLCVTKTIERERKINQLFSTQKKEIKCD